MDENTNKKTPEEQYLEELYKAIDTGEVPEGMIAPQLPSLQKSDYEFRKINIPQKDKKSLGEVALTMGRVFSVSYLIVGVIALLSTLHDEGISLMRALSPFDFSAHAHDMLVLLLWVFSIGTVTAGISSVSALFMRTRCSVVKNALMFAVFALCVFFAVITKNALTP